MDFITVNALSSVLLPPLDMLLPAAAGLFLLFVRRRAGLILLAVSIAGLFLLSMPIVGTTLAEWLENPYANGALDLKDAQAIVILGAGSYPAAPEYGGDTVAALTLERLRWGARLYRSSRLPVMLSGGTPYGTKTSEAAQMKASLNEDFGTPVTWLEERSKDTFESAILVRQQLAPAKIDRIALVTHALHMRRARLVFEQAGFRVIAAPTGFSTMPPRGILNYLPSAQGLDLSRSALHEAIGTGWYHVRFAVGGQRELP
jgi:uncharacterized SAM-binding protein YcdF (DUF218 family)